MAEQTIWKFTMPVEDTFVVDLPITARVLHVGAQYDIPCLWALIDLGADKAPRTFHTRGTGHDITGDEGEYRGTYMLNGGAFVGHVFEELRGE